MERIDSVFSNERLPFGRVVFLASNWKFLLLFTVLLLLIGAVLDNAFGMMWLARFGAMLTTLSLFQLWLSVRYLNYKDSIQPIREKYIPTGSSSWTLAEWSAHVKRNNPSMNEETAEMAASVLNDLSGKIETDLPRLSKVTIGLLELQILVAAIGTIVWAFGDLFANLLLHCGAWAC